MSSKKLNIFLDLMQIVEQGFIFKLKKKQPDITAEEIKKEVQKWYLSRPNEQYDDKYWRKGDISRFNK